MTPINKVLVSMPQPLVDEIITEGGLKLYISPDYNPQWHATVSGIVEGLPKYPQNEGVEIVERLNIGDEIAFNYKVVINKKYKAPSNERFTLIHNEPNKKVFTNAKKDQILIRGMEYNGNFIWAAIYTNKKDEWMDGKQGTQNEIEQWLCKYDFSKEAPFTYKNLIHHNETDLWQVDYTSIYAKKTANGIESISDRVIMKPYEIDITTNVNIVEKLSLPKGSVIVESKDKGEVISGGERLGIKKGDIVFFDTLYLERYEFWGEKYLLIKENRIHSINN